MLHGFACCKDKGIIASVGNTLDQNCIVIGI